MHYLAYIGGQSMTDHRTIEQQVLEVRIFPNFLWIHVEACFLWIPTKPFLIGV